MFQVAVDKNLQNVNRIKHISYTFDIIGLSRDFFFALFPVKNVIDIVWWTLIEWDNLYIVFEFKV